MVYDCVIICRLGLQVIAKVSRATATRHLAHLVELGCLSKSDAGGRSTRYIFGTADAF